MLVHSPSAPTWNSHAVVSTFILQACRITPSTQSNLFPKLIRFFLCWNSQSLHFHTGGVSNFYYTCHVMNRFIPHVHRARPLNGFENGPNFAENKIEYVLLTNWHGNSIFSANLAQRLRKRWAKFARQEQLHSGCSLRTNSLHKWVTIRVPGLPVEQGEVFLETTWILSGIQFTTHFIEFLWWKRNNSSGLLYTWSWHGKPQAGMRKANAER